MATTANKRIAKNTLALYLRMVVVMGVSFFTTRIVLEALGVVDYGIYNIVGGVVTFVAMITGSLTISVQRFLTFELGKKNPERVSAVFSNAVIIHLLMAFVVFALIEVVGLWYFKTSINIPAERYDVALTVFHLSAMAVSLNLAYTPFNALIISYERMSLFAYISIFDTLLRLGIAYMILASDSDRLELYALLMLVIHIVNALIYVGVWRVSFRDVTFRPRVRKDIFIGLASFASWSAFGQIAWAFTNQGSNILLNFFFGNVLNAAYGVTAQVMSGVQKFVQSFQTALNPQIIKNYAAEQFSEVTSLMFRGTRFSCFLLMVIELPLFFTMKTILNVWLVNVPDYTLSFCRLMLVNVFLDTLSNLFATVAQASGRIRKYQLVVSVVLFMNFPLSYLGLRYLSNPALIYVVYALVSVALLCVRIRLISRIMNRPIFGPFAVGVLRPVLLTLAVALIPSVFVSWYASAYLSYWYSFLLTFFSCFLFAALAVIAVGMSSQERSTIMGTLRRRLHK